MVSGVRVDRRQAILAAAFDVFARQGYSQTQVQEVADTAGVAKPTVYNHFGDKENLFREAMAAAAERVDADNLPVVDRLREPGDDLADRLRDVSYRLIQACCSERSRSLRWLTYAQVGRFPDLIATVQERTQVRLREALADRLGRLALAGQLRVTDPVQAAEQLLALLTGPMETRTRMGTRRVSAAETRKVAEAAVDTFLRAYGQSASRPKAPRNPA